MPKDKFFSYEKHGHPYPVQGSTQKEKTGKPDIIAAFLSKARTYYRIQRKEGMFKNKFR